MSFGAVRHGGGGAGGGDTIYMVVEKPKNA
jgi:hypothetical protein